MSFSDLHGNPEIYLSVKRIELISKHRKVVMQKLLCLGRNVDSEKWERSG